MMWMCKALDGMTKAFGMGVDFATALAIIAILYAGDVDSLTWSIGKWFLLL